MLILENLLAGRRRAAGSAVVAVVVVTGVALLVLTLPLMLVVAIGISDSQPEHPFLVWLEIIGLPWAAYGALAVLAVRLVQRDRVVLALAPALVLAGAAGGIALLFW